MTTVHSFIPEGNNVLVPTYALQRDPRYFSPYPESFWPDRWLEPEQRKDINGTGKLGDNVQVILEHGAFIPFSSGPRVCVAKALVTQEIRIVTSWIVQRFDIQTAQGFDLDQWERNLEDYYVMHKGSLPVQLTRRM
jgi:cytochrome P450